MKFAIISDIHVGEESEHKGVIRKLSRYSLKFLDDFIARMNTEVKPGFVVNLGDMINDVSYEADVKNLKLVLEALKRLTCPVFHLAGNHEQWTIEKKELESLIGGPVHYSFDASAYHGIVLFSEAYKGEDSTIGDEQKTWLQKELQNTHKKILVFVHHSLADQDLTGNFWFDERPNRALIGNREEIRKIMEESGKVVAVFNGHVHWNRMDVHNGIPYFNIQSLVENFNSDGVPAECHAVVEIDDKGIDVDVVGTDKAHYQYEFGS